MKKRNMAVALMSFSLASCIGFNPLASDVKTTRDYPYPENVSLNQTYDCLQDGLASRGYILRGGDFDNAYGINRFDIDKAGETVGSMEINKTGKQIAVSALIKDANQQDIIGSIETCQKSLKTTSFTESLAESILKAL